jgi:hypothetical protein
VYVFFTIIDVKNKLAHNSASNTRIFPAVAKSF